MRTFRETGRAFNAASALDAARYPMPLADSLFYAIAQRLGAIVWTQDGDFSTCRV